MRTAIINKKYHSGRTVNILLYIFAPILILAVSFVIASSTKIGAFIIIGIIGLALLAISLASPRIAFYLNLLYVFLVYFIQRLGKVDFPVSVATKMLIGAMFIGIMIKKIIRHERVWNNLLNPITIILLLNVVYIGIEAFNPNVSSLVGWDPLFRKAVEVFFYYLVTINIITSKEEVIFFIKFWLFMVFFCSLYACYEQWFGLFPWDQAWVTSSPQLYGILFQYGFVRKFSLLSDPPAYGILAASTAVLAICLILGNYSLKKKLILGIAAIFMLIGMSFSGTRTATILAPIGILFYCMMAIKNKKTILLLGACLFACVFILVAPIYNNSVLNRIRSAFHPSQDPSMELRNINRRSVEPYMHTHPIGGGVGTTGFPGLANYPNHPLAGFQPDGQFVQNALEIGWMGFGFELLFYFIILRIGIRNFYRCNDPTIKNIYAGITATIFCWVISEFSQSGSQAFNINYIYIPCLVILLNLKYFDSSYKKKKTMAKTN